METLNFSSSVNMSHLSETWVGIRHQTYGIRVRKQCTWALFCLYMLPIQLAYCPCMYRASRGGGIYPDAEHSKCVVLLCHRYCRQGDITLRFSEHCGFVPGNHIRPALPAFFSGQCNTNFIVWLVDFFQRCSRAGDSSSSTTLLRSLHWLPVKYRVHFKICLLTYKALHEEQPVYLRSLIAISLPSRSLRSNRGITLSIPRIKTNTGARAFSSCAPSLWNNLPLSVRSATSVATFRRRLKTYLFDLAFPP